MNFSRVDFCRWKFTNILATIISLGLVITPAPPVLATVSETMSEQGVGLHKLLNFMLTTITKPAPPKLPEPLEPISAKNIRQEPNQSNPADSLKAVSLAGEDTQNFLDIRGVGDAGMSVTHRQPFSMKAQLPQGVLADFGQRLDSFDPQGLVYRGDLSFLNWESTVGTHCQQFWAKRGPRSFAFMSHPDNLVEAYQRGFNLIGLANNHTRDCPKSEGGKNGALVTAQHLERLTQELQADWLWHGVGIDKNAVIKTLIIKGKPIRIAFANLYVAGGDCTYVACVEKDELTVLRSLRDADVDLRILSLHSWTDSTQKQLVNIGVKFIQYFEGDIVFGHGPHRWAPVRIVESETGRRGVLFESLGNFIHPSLQPSSQHLIGRVLFDLDRLELRQVQIIPIAVSRVHVSFQGTGDAKKVPANVTWKNVEQEWRRGVNAQVQGAYANILN